MTYAAWFELHDDPEVVRLPLAMRVYASLLRRPGIFDEPQPVKVQTLAAALRAHRNTTALAIDLLVRRGYLVEYARGAHHVRRVTVALVRECSTGTETEHNHRGVA